MSIFASRCQKVVPVPGDAPHTVTLQKLSGLRYQEVRKAADGQELPLRVALLRAGIVAWTYPDVPVDAAHIDDLEDDLAQALGNEILLLTKPSLAGLATVAEAEAKEEALRLARLTALHQALEQVPGAAQPFEYFISRLCEEFNCLPSAAYQEFLSVPVGFLEQVIEARHYAAAKARYDAAETKAQRDALLAADPMAETVQAVTFAMARAASDAAKQRLEGKAGA